MLERNMQNKNNINKSGKANIIHLKYHIYSRNFDIESNHRYNSEKIEESRQEYLMKNNLINSFKYNRFYYYDKQKNLSNNLKKQKIKKIKLNLKKYNNFHQFIILNKIKSSAETKDFDDLTSNIKTINNSEFMRTNLSSNINNQLSQKNIKKRQNHINDIKNLENSDNMILNNNIINYENYNNIFSNKNKNKDIENSNIIKSQTIINSGKVNKTKNFLNYKFKDIFGNPNDNLYSEGDYCSYRYSNSIISEQIKTKLKYNIINKIQNDFLQNQKEKMTNPIISLNHYEILHKKNKNYFEIFGNLIKKYFAYLYSNIENEKHKLNLLKEQKENLKEIIFQITKKINSKKDKKIFFENLLQLLIKIRYNVDSLDKIPKEYLKKYGIIMERNIKYVNSVVRKRNSTLITELKENFYMKYLRKSVQKKINNNKPKSKIRNRKTTILLKLGDFQSKNTYSYKPKSPTKRFKSGYNIVPKIPIFNSANELDGKMRGIEYNLKELFKELSSIRLTIQKLKLELNKLKSEYMLNKKNKNSFLSFIQTEKEDIINQKKEYEYLLNIKNSLVSSKFNYNDYKLNSNINSNKNNHHIFNFSGKLISFVLKININIEKLLKQDGIYKFLNSCQEKKIIYNSKEYNKTLFCVKILEIIYLYLIDERRKYLSDDKTKKIYQKFQDIIDKQNRIKKIQEKNNAEYQKRRQREKQLELKYNKPIILPIKKDDPFSFNFKRNKTIELNRKKRAKTENDNKIRLIFENEILY